MPLQRQTATLTDPEPDAMNNADYQDMPCISSHWLIDMLAGPAHCWRKHLDPAREIEAPSDALRMGTLVHCLALTPHQFAREFRVLDQSRRSKAGRAEWDWTTAQGWTPVRSAEVEKARAIVAALKADRSAYKLLRYGRKERTIIQPRAKGLLPLKARLDVHCEAHRRIVELKTTWNLESIEQAMTRYHYALSAAFYRHLVRGQSVIFVFVQTREPYPVKIIEPSRTELQYGERMWRTALEMFDICWKMNQWPEVDRAAPAEDDDPLMLPATPAFRHGGPRFDVPVGELAL